MSNKTQLQTNNSKYSSLIETLRGKASGTDTSDATASADEIFAGETAYTSSGKVTGTFTIDSELTEQNELISQISTLVATKANPQGGTDTSDATATAGDILSGKTAYVKGEKITGTHSGTEDLNTELTTQENLISQLSTILDSKAAGGSGGGAEWVSVRSLPQTYAADPGAEYITTYYEIPEGCIGVVFTIHISVNDNYNMGVSYRRSDGSFSNLTVGSGSLTVLDVDSTGTILQIQYEDSSDVEYYFMPLYEIT